MAILRPRIVSSRHFVMSAGVACCDISDFGKGFDFERVYDDACDEGLTVHSEKTGFDVVFALENVVRDNENDVLYWELISVTPGNVGHKMKIFND